MRDFVGFRFGNIHSEDLHLVVVSSSDRYEKNLLPEPTDYTADVPGGNGKYYFGQTHNTRDFKVDVAFDSVSEPIFRKISQLFANDKLQDLVFDEMPFKTYRAKIKQKPDFKFICFTNRDTGERVYKGEGTLNFICYFPYAFGFNKYVVRAADYYHCLSPENIIKYSNDINPYRQPKKAKYLPGLIKDHYNVRPNMNTPWKGGYPTIQQVQWGELYFTAPPEELRPIIPQDCSSTTINNKHLLIDVRGYWKNIPEWQSTAKLLTTPTLDYDQELIFMPQYNKINFMNMETGLNNEQGLIGSRILVYNPGDLPVEFELKMDNVRKRFRAKEGDYSFRINRYNVQRLTIEDAVDWTGLKTHVLAEDAPYKYGTRYFKILEQTGEKVTINTNNEVRQYNDFEFRNLKSAHPKHCYMVEPVPRQRLGHFIKTFYWESLQLNLMTDEEWEQGIEIANRYEELYSLCITEEEKYELYWEILKLAILSKYEGHIGDQSMEDFIYNYIQCPPEYFKVNTDIKHKYGQFDFNLSRLPIYITEDYFQINSDELFDDDVIEPSRWGLENDATGNSRKYRDQFVPNSLFLDSERRMLYNINNPEWKNYQTWLGDNDEKRDNFYNYKPSKTIRNEAIEQGHWFKLPPGWSLIDITPVVDENRWGGKLWEDGRPFDWGTVSQAARDEFNSIYERALRDYLKNECTELIQRRFNNGELVEDWDSMELTDLEIYAQFRRWYGEDEDFYGERNKETTSVIPKDCQPLITNHNLEYSLVHKLNEDAEYKFLKLLASYWNIAHTNENGKIESTIDDWWWLANNYLWANFPPLYWGYMDLLNQLQIKYTPLFY